MAGSSYAEVGASVGLSRHTIARHARHSAQPFAETEGENLSELELSDKRLATVADRLEQQFASACAVGDQKLALDATKALARVESERHRRLSDKQQATTEAAEKSGLSKPEDFDRLVEVVRNYAEQKIAQGWVRCPLCNPGHYCVVEPEIIHTALPEL
jgi:hypothetical protein